MFAEILLQRTRAENVVPVYEGFLTRYPHVESLAETEQPEVAKLLHPLGLHNRRSASLLEIAERIDGDKIPESRDELLELPHVGLYVANAVLCFGYGEPVPVVDSNVIRIYASFWNRRATSTQPVLWDFAKRVLADKHARRFNLALLDFAAKLCKATSPRCEECFATEYCEYYAENRSSD